MQTKLENQNLFSIWRGDQMVGYMTRHTNDINLWDISFWGYHEFDKIGMNGNDALIYIGGLNY